MIGIYLFLTIFSQLSPFSVWFQNVSLPNSSEEQVISVAFQKANDIDVGDPVLAEGRLIGTVTKISLVELRRQTNRAKTKSSARIFSQDNTNNKGLIVEISLLAQHKELLRDGTIALVSSPLSVASNQVKTVLELLIPPGNSKNLRDGARIVGYSSYEEFWSADFSRQGIKQNAFSL